MMTPAGRSALTALLLFPLFLFAQSAFSCTLWSAHGEGTVLGGGTLIAKNRDWVPDHRQILKTVRPKTGYRYFGIFAEGNDDSGLKAGINEKGLVVVSSTAGSIPKKIRREADRTKGLLTKLLRECDGIDAVLKKELLFLGPRNLLLADGKKIAVIEIGLHGEHAATIGQNGFLTHTNHYRDEKLLKYNWKIGESSGRRLERIEALLKDDAPPYSLDDFIAFSGDRSGGPDNGIWRTGGSPGKERTLSVWIVHSPPRSSPRLYIKIANPQEKEEVHRPDFRDLF